MQKKIICRRCIGSKSFLTCHKLTGNISVCVCVCVCLLVWKSVYLCRCVCACERVCELVSMCVSPSNTKTPSHYFCLSRSNYTHYYHCVMKNKSGEGHERREGRERDGERVTIGKNERFEVANAKQQTSFVSEPKQQTHKKLEQIIRRSLNKHFSSNSSSHTEANFYFEAKIMVWQKNLSRKLFCSEVCQLAWMAKQKQRTSQINNQKSSIWIRSRR